MADHDSGYKLLFSHPRMVEELLRDFVREDWVSSLDFKTLKKVGGSFVSDDLRERHSDTIWRLRSKGPRPRWFYVYLLLEFQSTPDPFMAVRLMGYVALLHSELIRTGAVTAASGLPTVMPLVSTMAVGPGTCRSIWPVSSRRSPRGPSIMSRSSATP